jgi:hypothetical protein
MKSISKYLSKSDFQVASTCDAKLYYKKHHYPTADEGNEYVKVLKDNGFMIGLIAKLIYPAGIEVTGTTEEAIAKTETLLQENDEITLFEAGISIDGYLIRIDILEKRGNQYNLIEVKSKSFDSVEANNDRDKYWKKPKFQPYIQDVAFQKMVFQKKFPQSNVKGFLLCPDKAKITQIEGMIGWFEIEKNDAGGFNKSNVKFTGTKDDLEALRKDHILGLAHIDQYIELMLPNIALHSEKYLQSIIKDEKLPVQINYKCRDCEYKISHEKNGKNGFKECWGELADPTPHILELGQLGNVNKRHQCINTLIEQGKTSIKDIPLEFLSNKDGSPFYNNRPLYQVTKDEEIMDEGFWDEADNFQYPLHFIDCETASSAIPFHAGMPSYQNVIFQWSCHTIQKPGDEPIHSEWLNVSDVYPNKQFAESLKKHIGFDGTFFQWSSYENVQLKAISKTLNTNDGEEVSLLGWIEEIAEMEKGDRTNFVDLNRLARDYYFHPIMKGRTSIKVTLPAVLQAYKSKRITKWLMDEGLYKKADDGSVINPYDLLPEPEPIYEGKKIKVKEGTAAMIAYQDMNFGLHKRDEAIKKQYVDALLKYCKLDTLAMVIIWEHWMGIKK